MKLMMIRLLLKSFATMILPRTVQTFRILFRERKMTLINMIGLSISLACTLMMLLWVADELSYDRFHENYKQLYRVEEDQYYSGQEPYHVTVTPYVSGPVWKEEIPEITRQCRMARAGGMLFTYGDHKFFEDRVFSVDSSFFELFGFHLKYGNRKEVLRDPYSMVITEEIARKYFGDEDPLGKSVLVNQEDRFTVSGVVERTTKNTVLEFDVLLPWHYMTTMPRYTDSWNTNSIMTYVKLQEGCADSVVSRKITEVTGLHKEGNTIDFMVAPLHKIHLHSYFGYGHSPGAVLYVYIFSAIALFVLLIACINFMNLSTARSSIRAKEIGLRKVSGASREQLVRQHLFESFIQVLCAMVLAFLTVLALISPFNLISGKDIEPSELFSAEYILGALAVLLFTTLLAGSYPALFLSGMKPDAAIRDQADPRKGSGLLRKILVVFQFSLAVLLITGALVASRQLNYMRSAELGFDKTNLVHIQLRGNLNREYGVLKKEFMRDPDIVSITASMQPPYRIGSNSSGINWEGKDPEQSLLVSYTGVHDDFTQAMGITMEAGRGFSEDYPGDMLRDTMANFIINGTLAGIIGKEEIVGMKLRFMGLTGQVVGVMKDFHFQPLGNSIEPMALAPVPAENLQHMIVRVAPGGREGALRFMEEKWHELLPQYPFEYEFVDGVIDDMYRSEERMASLLKIFTLVAMVIASLGLFALASFTAEKRAREIGIRKIMGAMQPRIVMMVIRDFSMYILISLLIALPAVWFIARWWLNEFSFRITLQADLFLITSLITVLVAVLTVLYHAVRIAGTDPVEALRYE
ncbi:MAG TPA: ABC transporter permease [Bacteroides sp.]|nr:ABC transporter permease [Bacteroides sp.]